MCEPFPPLASEYLREIMPSNPLCALLPSLGGLPLIAGQKGSRECSVKIMPLSFGRKPRHPRNQGYIHLLGVTLAHKTSVLLFGSAPEKILPLSPHRTLQLPHSETLNAPAPSGPCATYPPLPPLPPLHLLIKEFLVLERRENTNAQIWIEFGDCLC